MNPYDFVSYDVNRKLERQTPAGHLRFADNCCTGWIRGTVSALTPLLIPEAVQTTPKQFLRSRKTRQAIIPGSTLKGLFRSLVETVGPGCWRLFDGNYDSAPYRDKLPAEYRGCENPAHLCPACRLFGMLSRSGVLYGKVACEDAICVEEKPHPAGNTPPMASPKPRHSAWYLRNGHVAGRKFFFHQDPIQFSTDRLLAGRPLVQALQPLGPGSRFEFSVSFQNVALQDEWPLLIYALTLESEIRHKVGYAKPAGLGSIEVALTEIALVDPAARYRRAQPPKSLKGSELAEHVSAQRTKVVQTSYPGTLADLRRIWAWPPRQGVSFRYPDQDWFGKHSQDPIGNTP